MEPTGYYKLSGKAPVAAIGKACVALMLLGAVLGWLYGFLISYVPLLKIGIILSIVCAAGFGAIVMGIGGLFRIRSLIVMVLLGVMAAFFWEYGLWSGWLYGLSSRELLVFDPYVLAMVVIELGAEGVYTVKGDTPKGTFLYSLWGAQALTVMGLIIGIGASQTWNGIFSESSNTWINTSKTFLSRGAAADPAVLKHQMEMGDFSALLALPYYDGDGHYTNIEVYHNFPAEDFFVANISANTIVLKPKDTYTTTTKPIIKRFHLPRAVWDELTRSDLEFTKAQEEEQKRDKEGGV